MQRLHSPYLQAWITFFAITTVGGAIAGGVGGAIVGFALKDSNVSRALIVVLSGLAGLVASAPISFYTFKWVARTMLVEPLLPKSADQSAA